VSFNHANLNDNGSELTVSVSRGLQCIHIVRFPLCVDPLFTTSLHSHSLNPLLTLRFAVSLKRSADSDGGQKWQLKHFSTIDISASYPSPDAQVSSVHEDIELDLLDPLKHRE